MSTAEIIAELLSYEDRRIIIIRQILELEQKAELLADCDVPTSDF
jgi:hypothetical protein